MSLLSITLIGQKTNKSQSTSSTSSNPPPSSSPTLSIAVISAFIGYYAFIPFSVIFLINAFLTFCCTSDSHPGQIVSLVTSFFTPSVLEPIASVERSLLKRSTLVSTIVLLISLVAIFLLPTNESALLATPGLHSLNFGKSSSPCNPVCNKDHINTTISDNITIFNNITHLTANTNTGCETMYTPFRVYTNYIFPLLTILGLACLIEGILIQFKRKGAKTTRFWTPYQLADAEWLHLTRQEKLELRRKNQEGRLLNDLLTSPH